ncbi:MAG: amidase family protein [Alphaproteobacteria bacterium]
MNANAYFLSLDELRQAYGSGETTPLEVTEGILDRAKRLNPSLNCFREITEDMARRQARAATERWKSGRPSGLLDGVPISVKDTLMLKGVAFRRGSLATPDTPSEQSAPVVDRALDQGAVVVGITTTPEFGVGPITISPLTGVTRNPWDLTKNSGGSSGGAAASVAAGLSYVALATDAGGSTRIPAGFCGVVGLKPTGGRIPTYPPNVAGALSSPGIIGRSVDDVRQVLPTLAIPDSRDADSMAAPSTGSSDFSCDATKSLRVAVSLDLGYALRVSREIANCVKDAIGRVDESGLSITTVDPPISNPIEIFNTLFRAGFAYSLRNFTEEQLDVIGDTLRATVEKGKKIGLHPYLQAHDERRKLAAKFAEFFESYDALVTPMTSVTAFDAERWVPEEFEDMEDPRSWTPFGYPVNLIQCPAITIPCALSSAGLPIALQVIGPRFGEAQVLSVAKRIESSIQALPPIPPSIEELEQVAQ